MTSGVCNGRKLGLKLFSTLNSGASQALARIRLSGPMRMVSPVSPSPSRSAMIWLSLSGSSSKITTPRT
ncbi:hypothetical protein D3C77_255720 [compost metagenome]